MDDTPVEISMSRDNRIHLCTNETTTAYELWDEKKNHMIVKPPSKDKGFL